VLIIAAELISGRWPADRPGCIISGRRSTLDESGVYRYEILTDPMPALKLDPPFQYTDTYALIRRAVAGSDAPTVVDG
jgi:hypothetical protein